MELNQIVTYQDFKSNLDTELKKAAEGFVRIGYLLKVARDTNVLHESGYPSVAAFAEAEYGLTKDIVSRYIAINDRYSEGGYSDCLQERFRPYGVAKLAEMLTLTDEVIDSLSPKLTKKEIIEIKKEIKDEEQRTDIEVILEEKDDRQQHLVGNLEKFMYQCCYENKERYTALHKAITGPNGSRDTLIEKILDIIAPSGIEILFTRIPGLGRLMLSIKGKDNLLELVNIRSNEKEIYEWKQLIKAIEGLRSPTLAPEKNWEAIYGEEFAVEPPKPEIAPVQPEEQDKVIEKESVLEKPERQQDTEEKNILLERAETEAVEPVQPEPPEEQLPGQAHVTNYPEILPNNRYIEIQETVVKSPENVIEVDENVIEVDKNKSLEEQTIKKSKEIEVLKEIKEELEKELDNFVLQDTFTKGKKAGIRTAIVKINDRLAVLESERNN
jgi:hypothetical protein